MSKTTPLKPKDPPRKKNAFLGARQQLISFDGGETSNVEVFAPDRYRFFDDRDVQTPRIARGGGLSYCAASFGDQVQTTSHLAFNRILDFDSTTGEVEVEPGIDLWTLYCFLIQQGFYLPCHPGHGAITIGGCIAADVHGKNHVRDGTFVNQVLSLDVFHPLHGTITLSRTENVEIFDLTCGGFGLTGHIVRVRLKPQPIASSEVVRAARRFDSFATTIAELVAQQETSDFAYTWHDMSRPGPGFGGGYVHSGVIAPASGSPNAVADLPDVMADRLWGRLPVNGAVNYYTTPLLNHAYHFKQRREARYPRVPLHNAVFPINGSESYFALFGRRGFHEVQMLVPMAHIPEVIEFLETMVRRDRLAIALASAKLFDGQPKLLRYTGKGVSLALNLPRTPNSGNVLADLDAIIIRCAGRSNLIKDSRLTADTVEACYPEFGEFRRRLKDFDPQRMFRSELSKRIGL